MLLFGIFALSFGIAEIASFFFTDILFNLVLGACAVVVGLVFVILGVLKSNDNSRQARNENEKKRKCGDGVCTVCGLNVSAKAAVCPRCHTPTNQKNS